MSDLIIANKSDLVDIADEIRELSGTSESMGLDDMVAHIGEANDEVDSQAELLALVAAALEGKAGGSGDMLPTLSNPASALDILSDKEAIDGNGNVLTGAISTKTPSDLTANGATVTIPAGYYATQATKSVATAAQAVPSIGIDANGKITASVTQTAGYVSAGTKYSTQQLTTQTAKTVIPSTSSQIAVASGVYTTGAVTVAGDANLVAENIAEGVNIFGVIGTHSGGGSSGDESESLIGDWICINELPVTYPIAEDESVKVYLVLNRKPKALYWRNGGLTDVMNGIMYRTYTDQYDVHYSGGAVNTFYAVEINDEENEYIFGFTFVTGMPSTMQYVLPIY